MNHRKWLHLVSILFLLLATSFSLGSYGLSETARMRIIPHADLLKINSPQSENLPFAVYEPIMQRFSIYYEYLAQNRCCQYTYRSFIDLNGNISGTRRIFYGGAVIERGPVAHFNKEQNRTVVFWSESVTAGKVKSGLYTGLIAQRGNVIKRRLVSRTGGTVQQAFAYNPITGIYVNADESLITVTRKDGSLIKQYISGENFLSAILINTGNEMTIVSECNDFYKYCFSLQRIDSKGSLIKASKVEIPFRPREFVRYVLNGAAYDTQARHLLVVFSLWTLQERANVYTIKISLAGKKLAPAVKIASGVDKMSKFGLIREQDRYIIAYARQGLVFAKILDKNGLAASAEVQIGERIEGSDSVGSITIVPSVAAFPYLIFWNARTPSTQVDVYGRLVNILH
jgi:hypothetical protein